MVKRCLFTILCIMISTLFATGSFAQTTTSSAPGGSGPKVTPLPPLGINSVEKMQPNGELVIYVLKGQRWQEAGSISFDKFLREKKVDLGKFVPVAKTVKLRLKQKGGGAAHLDSVFLGAKPPLKVNNGKAMPLKQLSKGDNDLVNIDKQGVEVTFPASGKNTTLAVTARIESTTISQTPFQFPLENLYREMNVNSKFYTYRLNSAKGTLRIGGMQKATSAQKPFYQEYVRPGSGHPPGYIYGWVMNDDQNLYVAQEFTPDNTMDGDKDYAKVYVKTDTGLKEFKVSVPETRWGKSSFIYTGKVAYQHKFYEFVIPLKELGIKPGNQDKDLSLAFAGYGTMAASEVDPAMAYDPVNKRYLVVYKVEAQPAPQLYGQLIQEDGTPSGVQFPITLPPYGYASNFTPSVAYDSVNQKFLAVWADDPDDYGTNIYGQLVNADGTLNGANFTIYAGPNNQQRPSVAYDSINKRFLVAWEDIRMNIEDTDIYGQLVNANGALYGSDFPIAADYTIAQTNPSIAFDKNNQRFLVTWDSDTGQDINIYGQLVKTDGTPYGANFNISGTVDNRHNPVVAYDGTNQRFLVTWTEYNITDDVYGRLVQADGTPYGDRFAISNADGNQNNPSVAYDGMTGEFLVAWTDQRNVTQDVYGQMVNANGTLDGANFDIASKPVANWKPRVAYNPNGPSFLVAYESTVLPYPYYIYDIAFDRVFTEAQATAIIFKDDNLIATVRKALNKPMGPITVADMATLTRLEVGSASISDLTGLEYATNLQELWLNNKQISDLKSIGNLTNLQVLGLHANQISDITQLTNLTKLRLLYLTDNLISDLKPLANLTNLKGLYLWGNRISDLTPLANLTGLQELWLNHNQISDLKTIDKLINLQVLALQANLISNITTLAKLTKLQGLYLNNNQISDITPLANLTNLQGLYLWNNQIADIAPLVANSQKGGLGQGSFVYIQNNKLDLTAGSPANNYIQNLKGSGIITSN